MKSWYTEEDSEYGVRYSYRTSATLFSQQSDFQKIDVIETDAFGRMLLIDDFVMLTDQDEFVYHEMLTHVPVCRHKDPKQVVVIGGGDGGTVRELLKYPSIEKIVLCEIDGLVVDACKKYFPQVAGQLDDPRVEVRIGDGLAYMRDHAPDTLDLVLVDSTDPIGPGEGLFTREFYASVAKALHSDGMMAAQSESPWHKKESLGRIQNNIAGGFDFIFPYVGPVPTYPRGFWSWTMASKAPLDPKHFDAKRFEQIESGLQYLNADLMSAVFALPNFYKKKLQR